MSDSDSTRKKQSSKVKKFIIDQFNKTNSKIDQVRIDRQEELNELLGEMEELKEAANNAFIAKHELGFGGSVSFPATKPDLDSGTDDDDINECATWKVECTGTTGPDDCDCWLCESYREDEDEDEDAEDDQDKDVKTVSRIRYDDTDESDSDDSDNDNDSDSDWDDEDFDGLGFTSGEETE